MSERYLTNNAADREQGKLWERQFCRMAAWFQKAFHAFQIDRDTAARWQKGERGVLLPDIMILTTPGEYHEVKHKNPTSKWRVERRYGWEAYRLHALTGFQRETQQTVFYTIHDWEAAGARTSDAPMPNRLQDWRIANIQDLEVAAQELRPQPITTWLNAQVATCPGYYWSTSLWLPLDLYWGLPR
jgi:hypothetical protein